MPAYKSPVFVYNQEVMPRLTKQLLYGLLYGIIFIGLPIGIYFSILKPAPTCWDEIQNGKELGVDCGGNCPQACIPKNLRPLEAGDVKILPVDKEHASLFVEVTNSNVDYAAPSVNYVLTLEGGGILPGTSYFYGGEVRTLVFPNMAVPAGLTQASIAFEMPMWIPAAEWRRPGLRVLHAETRQDASSTSGIEGQLVVEGELVSDDTITFPSVEVVALFRGKFGEVAGISRTELSEVAPAVTRTFRIFHPGIPEVDAGATSVILSARRP